MAANVDVRPIQEPLAELERRLIEEYIRGAGFDPDALRARTDAAAKAILTAAAEYAAGKLSEVESRQHYLRSLRGEG